LDQPGIHDNRGRLEHRLGIQMCTRSSQWSFVPGIRDHSWSDSQRNPRGQRERRIRAIGDISILPRCAKARG
jgi:hypothetical protein